MSGKMYGDRKQEMIDFEIYPKIVQTGKCTTIHVRNLYPHKSAAEGAPFTVKIMPTEGYGQTWTERFDEPKVVNYTEKELQFSAIFSSEQEYIIELKPLPGFPEAAPVVEKNGITLRLRVYALDEDLFVKRPWKGDIHMHSHHSDGRESPGFVAASCRKIGLDFMAVTDHGQYAPSIEAQENYAETPIDLLICRGEEVHPPENPVHMIHFGGSSSMNELMKKDPDKYYAEVSLYEADLQEISDPKLRYHIASCCWVFDNIRKANGLGVFCHPYWFVREGYHIAGAVTDWMFEHKPYDAYEVIGGYHKYELDSNMIQVARYYEERIKGRKVPIVGVSDAHGCAASDLFGWYYTIVWSEDLERVILSDAIREEWSVAVTAVEGEAPRAYGPFRLTKLALFLLREVFPLHDSLCDAEGEAMFSHLRGEPEGKASLARLSGGVKKLYKKLWA